MDELRQERQAAIEGLSGDRLALNWRHVFVGCVCALGMFFDAMEIAMGSAISAVFSAPAQQVAASELAWLLSSAYLGAVMGAPLFGWIGDRFGRRGAMMGALALLAVSSLAAGSSHGFGALLAFRLLSGFAIGAYPPLMVAYLADLLAPAYRGRVVMVVSGLALLGGPAAIFLVRWLTPLAPWGIEAWRWGFVAGGVGSGLVCLAFLRLRETPKWLWAAGREAEAHDAYAWLASARPLGRLGMHRPHEPSEPPVPRVLAADAGRSAELPRAIGGWQRVLSAQALFFGALFFLSPWASVGFGLLSGAALVAKGLSVQDSLLMVGLFTFGAVTGSLLASLVVDRLERRSVLVVSALVMAVTCTAFAASSAWWPMAAASFLFGVFAAAYVPSLSLYLAEMVPTRSRALASSGAWAVNRLASVLVPLALLPLLKAQGAMPMCAVMAATLVLSALLLARGQPGHSGRAIG